MRQQATAVAMWPAYSYPELTDFYAYYLNTAQLPARLLSLSNRQRTNVAQ